MNRKPSIDIHTLKKQHTQAAPPGNQAHPLMKQLEALLTREFSLFGKPFPDKIKESFYLELGSLMDAGLDIRTALQLIRDEQTKKAPRAILSAVLEKVINGSSLSTALRENKSFTPYEYFTIEIGEETGKLNTVLQQLSVYYQSKIRQRRQIIGALTYPIIVLSVAFCSVFFMMNYVVPMFADVFRRFGGNLPFLTRQVLLLSHFMQAAAGKLFLLLLTAIVFISISRSKPWYKKYKDLLLQKMPVIKNIVSKIYLARFASTMQLLLGARVPLVQALGLSKQVMGFYPLETALEQMEQDILKGLPLHESMSSKNIFPSKMVALVKVGEEVNELELFFKNLSDRYSGDLDYQTTQLSKFIEPVIIIVLGLVVGVVLIAMYLPMFNMGNTIR
ncbi:type II secretion system F family protein [Niabella drilacis]|uniref:General secretion pathway protein F n=1 Tax=Niabella drilacis (strain DSM 25811 / CCM 8410 / CCUG 62505 / LMG 26954 / E90) TaxID=1285928 RepID=A0A1G6USV7_NIADE|nr:type II secretion system F family protein [Niabella drilacis]SDD44402.1 type IV pilus assembly protein PilC [Niabella drilacis]